MNKSQLKTLLKHILLEIKSNEMIANKDEKPDVFGAINVESTNWVPDSVGNSQWYKDIQMWTNNNLDATGRYKGEPLHNYGFLYKVGDVVPVTNRYSAMMSWNQAKKSREINLKLGKPAGIEESNFVNKLKQKLREKTNPDGTYSDDMEDAIRMKKAEGLSEMTTSSAAGGQPGGTISVPAWGTKNKEGSPKAIQATKKMKGWKVAKSISTEGK